MKAHYHTLILNVVSILLKCFLFPYYLMSPFCSHFCSFLTLFCLSPTGSMQRWHWVLNRWSVTSQIIYNVWGYQMVWGHEDEYKIQSKLNLFNLINSLPLFPLRISLVTWPDAIMSYLPCFIWTPDHQIPI